MQEQSANVKLEEDYEQKNSKSTLNIQRRISIGLVLKRIADIKDHFKLDEDFLDTTKEILELFWPYIKNTKLDVIVGFTCTITLIRLHISTLNYIKVSNFLRISSGSLLNRIKKFFVHTLHEEDFISLKKSSNLICTRLNMSYHMILINMGNGKSKKMSLVN